MVLPLLLACTTVSAPPVDLPPLRSAAPDRVRLAVVGDVGRGTRQQAQVASALRSWCAEAGCDAVLIPGDLLYPRGMEAPDDPRAEDWVAAPYRDAGPLYLALGNHDYGHGRNVEKAGWSMDWAARTEGVELPGPAYAVALGDVGGLLVVDTNAAFQFDAGPAEAFLGERLPALDGWRVVMGHHPFRSNGPHGNAGAYEGWRGLPWLSGRALESLYTSTLCPDADLFLAGHDHNLQILDHCGVQLVVSGAGGAVREVVDRGNDAAFTAAAAGFVWLSLHDDGRGEAVVVSGEGEVLHREALTRRLRPPR